MNARANDTYKGMASKISPERVVEVASGKRRAAWLVPVASDRARSLTRFIINANCEGMETALEMVKIK